VNSQDYDKRSALHLAACEGHVEVVKHLLAMGANPTLRDRFGGTALHDSVRHRQTFVHQHLKDAGCQLTGMDTAIVLCKCAASGDTWSTFVMSKQQTWLFARS
jgi:ankyrin repeat protein